MSDISPDKNRYTLNWIIEDFNVQHLAELDSKEIRSPLFTADNLGQSSWFLAIHYHPLPGESPIIRCSIARCSEDEGPEKIFIQFQFSATLPGGYYHDRKVKDASKVIAFEKGYSSVVCDLERNQDIQEYSLRSRSQRFFVLKCQMTEYSSAKNPVSRGSTIRSKINDIDWWPEGLLEMKLLSGPRGVQYEIFFHELNDIISIRIRRSDSNDSTECCVFFSLNVDLVNECPMKAKDSLFKTFLINDTFDVPTSLKKNSLSGSEFQYSTIYGFILTSFVINVSSKPEGKLAETSTAHEFDSADILKKEQLRMYEDGIHADVKLQVGSKWIPAHKCVLASRSPVFSAMFDEEEQTGIVSISDVDESTLDALVKYLYATVVEGLDFESALKLLEAADKYQVVPLREKCAAYLRDSLSVENACQVLAVAENTSHQDLKSQAMDYVRAHADEILLSDSCIQLTRNNHRLMAEILTAMSY